MFKTNGSVVFSFVTLAAAIALVFALNNKSFMISCDTGTILNQPQLPDVKLKERLQALSEREKEILRLASTGSNKQ